VLAGAALILLIAVLIVRVLLPVLTDWGFGCCWRH
jgi:hypothetical protein